MKQRRRSEEERREHLRLQLRVWEGRVEPAERAIREAKRRLEGVHAEIDATKCALAALEGQG